MTIKEIQNEIIEDFSIFDDWMEKYEYLIDLAKSLPELDEKYRNKSNLIKGCQSMVWLNADLKNGKINFQADSNAIIVKGIVSLLIKVFSDQKPKDILKSELFFIKEIGLLQNLSPTRSNGLTAVIKKIRLYALAFDSLSI
ncbi:MAG: Fe-S metabolism protein SufE [Bacteroidetes bacterium 4572_128]|nr:MAG: Fe-S metabolism protein SufE [Bacteroidetes bacterium 4572_128]